jgi:NhaP-type Na+/H+ or K+/H+ antiporter
MDSYVNFLIFFILVCAAGLLLGFLIGIVEFLLRKYCLNNGSAIDKREPGQPQPSAV